MVHVMRLVLEKLRIRIDEITEEASAAEIAGKPLKASQLRLLATALYRESREIERELNESMSEEEERRKADEWLV